MANTTSVTSPTSKHILDELGALSARLDKLAQPVYPDGLTPGKVFGSSADAAEAGRLGWHTMGEQLLAIRKAATSRGTVVDPRLTPDNYAKAITKAFGLSEKDVQSMSEGVGSDGGFLLAPTFVAEILKNVHESAGLWSRTRGFPISGPSIKVPAIDETSRATGSRRGGITGYWVGEGDAITKSKPKFKLLELAPQKMAVLSYLTDEMIEDGGGMMESMLPDLVAEEIDFQVGDAIINGTGVGKPLGILNSSALISVSKEVGQAAATITTENIVKMWARLHASSQANAEWLVNQDTFPQLHTMTLGVGTGGTVVYMPPGGLSGQPYATLMGKPVIPTEYNATLGTVGDIILWDPKQYITVRRDPIKAQTSIHVEFLTEQTAFRFTLRVDGKPWWTSALTPFKGTATQSPFVALATRA